MANITRERTGYLLRTLFQLLRENPEGLKASHALEKLASRVQLSHYEAGDYESGGRRFEKIVRFATVDAVKAGWMIKDSGIWTITDAGQQAHDALVDPEAFYVEAVRLYQQWKKGQPLPEVAEAVDESVIEHEASITLETAEETAREQIHAHLAAMPPYEFQELVGSLLTAMGYHVAWIAPPGKDGGVDVLAFNDPLGTRPPRIKVQVKRNAGSPRIDVMGLRSFMAVLGEGDVGLFVALSGFTKDAELEARTSHRRITLIDADQLIGLWTRHHAQLDDTARRRLPLKPVWFLAAED